MNLSHTNSQFKKPEKVNMTVRESEKQNPDRALLSNVYENLCFHDFCRQNEIFYVMWDNIVLSFQVLTVIYYSSLF